MRRGPGILALATLFLTIWSPVSLAQVPAVGIYTDTLGLECNFIDNSPGTLEAHVVVVSIPGVSGVQFAAPKPPCFAATWLVDTPVFPVTIGSSQTGVSIGVGSCLPVPVHVLTLHFFSDGTTPACCRYDVLPEPNAGIVGIADCGFNTIAGVGFAATINGNGSCPCDNNIPPNAPSNPTPSDGSNGIRPEAILSWEASDPENWPLTYDIYFGTQPSPPLVVQDHSENSYDPVVVELGTVYYWKVVARDIRGARTEGPVWSFTTLPPASARLVVSSVLNYCGLVTSDTVMIEIAIHDNPSLIDAAGVDVTYDPSLLTLLSCEPGELTAGWSVFGCSDQGTSIRIGGFDATPIPVGSLGTFARLFFLSHCCNPDSAVADTLCLENPTDDFVTLWRDCGIFRCETFAPDGDVNADGNVTPGDALCAFESFLSFPSPPVVGCNQPGWDVRSDVDCSAVVTPGDALCIFQQWLDGSCLFCGGGGVPAVAATVEATADVSIDEIRLAENEISVPVRVGQLPAFQAFGFEVAYPPDQVEYLGLEWKTLSVNFERIDGRLLRAGRLRLGGYALEAVDATAAADLVELRFRARSDDPRGTLVVERFFDDLAGAAAASTDLSRTGDEPPAITGYVLHQNVPNPFNPETEIRYEVPATARVTLAVYDVEGRLIRQLVNETRTRGVYRIRWDGRNQNRDPVSSGVYFYLLRAGGQAVQKKMVLLK